MILISHRGNLTGRVKERENSPDYIQEALDAGFDVEIDVWKSESKWYLGHDKPQYEVSYEFLRNPRLWCHAKNLEALYDMSFCDEKIHFFWHQKDDFTLTSKGFIWTYPGQQLTDHSICVLPERAEHSFFSAYGVCSDYIMSYKPESE